MKVRRAVAVSVEPTVAVLSRVEFLHDLDPAALRVLADDLRLLRLKRGDVVYRQGELADALYIVVAGKIKVCSHARDGREKLLEIRGPADVFGAVSMLDPGPRTATAVAMTTACVATADSDTLRRWMIDRPHITDHLLRLMARRLRTANRHLLDVVFDDVAGRVAKELLRLAERFGARRGDLLVVHHDLTQKEIAQLVGATRESVNKALCDFAARGWITTDGKCTVIHRADLLARRAE
jgi:CRP-like cAMP-binding protein